MLQDKDLVSIQEARSKVEKAYAASVKYRAFSQERVDAVVEHMAAAARSNARHLAEMAVEETGYGNAKDKYIKNLLACDWLPRKMRGMKTVGIVNERHRLERRFQPAEQDTAHGRQVSFFVRNVARDIDVQDDRGE